ncbi:hypothetical protein BC830DRAFT_1135905 [Chytriomyces sp. MP71]|nr:hypothetical protein BC830DRAFT_1135905 [Chytriomyces sp. MP71]
MTLFGSHGAQRKRAVAAKTTAPTLAAIDDKSLLELEREARVKHKRNLAQGVGSAAKLVYKSPVALMSIARTGLAASQTYVEHDTILQEVKRRGLTPLEPLPHENIYVMVAGQLVAVAVGHKMGEKVAHGVIEPMITRFGGIAVEQMTARFTEFVAENVAENVMSSAAANATIPVNTTQGTQGAQGGAAVTSASQASGINKGRTNTVVSAAFSAANKAVELGKKTASTVNSTVFRKPSSVNASSSSLQPSSSLQSSHFSGMWVGIAEELEITFSNDRVLDEDDIRALKGKLNAVPDTDGAGHTKIAEIIASYRMSFLFNFEGYEFAGKNLVDDLEVNGIIHEGGVFVDFVEVAVSSEGEEVTVQYIGRISGGMLIGEWVSSDGRSGLYKLKHI